MTHAANVGADEIPKGEIGALLFGTAPNHTAARHAAWVIRADYATPVSSMLLHAP